MLFLVLVKWMGVGAGFLVVVGGFAPSGVNVNNNYDYDNENIGVAALRKFFYFPRWDLKISMGDGLYPTADHSSNFLDCRLNHKILRIIDGSSIFCQSD